VLAEQLMEGDVEGVVRKVVEAAKAGDMTAARLILDRVLPPPRSRTVALPLTDPGEHDGATTIVANFVKIIQAMAAGEVSPAEALEIAELVDRQRQAIAELKPDTMRPAPTAEELERRRRAAERQAEVDRSTEAILDQMMGLR
jgi:hypothetical protein